MLTLAFGKNAAEETIGLQRCKKDSLDKGREKGASRRSLGYSYCLSLILKSNF